MASFVDPDKVTAAVPDDLEIFDTLDTSISIQRTYVESIRATNQFREDMGDITFEMSADSDDYFTPYGAYITALLEIQQSDGTAIVDGDRICFENDGGHSWIERVMVELGNQVVVSDMHYGYTNQKQALLLYGTDANASHRTSSLYHKDTAGKFDAFYTPESYLVTAAAAKAVDWKAAHPDGQMTEAQKSVRDYQAAVFGLEQAREALNDGAQKRGAYTAGAKSVWVKIYLSCDFFKIKKYIPNGVGMRIRLTRAPPKFCLHCPKTVADAHTFKVLVKEPTLWITKATVLPEIYNEQNQTILVKRAKYNILRHTVKTVIIPARTTFFSIDNISVGQIPRRVVFGFVKNSAFDGAYELNPFNYEHINMQSVALYIHGVSHPLTPFTPRYTGNNIDYSREYESLFKVHGIDGQKNAGFPISRDDYPNGYCLYAVDLTGNKGASDKSMVGLKSTGNVKLEFRLSQATGNESYVCMFFTEHDHIIKIDGHRNVTVTYAL